MTVLQIAGHIYITRTNTSNRLLKRWALSERAYIKERDNVRNKDK